MSHTYKFNPRYTYRTLPNIFYHNTQPLVFNQPSYILFNDDLADALSLSSDTLKTQSGLSFLLGNHESLTPLSMAYAGHQYGNFTILGDGRAHLVMEHQTKDTLVDIHLKGSGPSPYSRGFDGRSTLRSALLEYLMSHALDALNIPTTKALAVIKTGDQINRIGLKDAGILVRVAKSHLRVGTFEYAVYKDPKQYVKPLVDYAIKRHDPDLMHQKNIYITWYQRVVKRQAELIAKWQSVGFVHGVMNTDNMTISGETIDFGPCAFIDNYNLNSVYSSIDTNGRYAYGNQRYMAYWNLSKLGQMILPLITSSSDASQDDIKTILTQFSHYFERHYYDLMAQKLGFYMADTTTISLTDDLLNMMAKYALDYTETFVQLTYHDNPDFFPKQQPFNAWKAQWEAYLKKTKQPNTLMTKVNPVIIPRNHIVKALLDDASTSQDMTHFNTFLSYLKNPYDITIPKKFRQPNPSPDAFVTYCGT
jgi:uncharacterized protein YdiU (UPF0061 family)